MELMPYVKDVTMSALVCALRIITEIHTKVVNQNASSVLIVQQIKPVSATSVKTPVLEFVERTLSALLLITFQSVLAYPAFSVIHSTPAHGK